MKISGFSFVRDGDSLYYPVAEAIRSVLPIVDEFVIAVGSGRPGDATRQRIEAIGDPRIRILDTVWDESQYVRGAIHAIQTDIAMKACSGDWLLYLQADEVIHERYLPVIRRRCEAMQDREDVNGLLFRYKHFWGDYDHHLVSSAWYNEEIRCVRNLPDMHSWHSAQSFRRIPEYKHPWQERSETIKLRAVRVDAEIFHYGWVRPPRFMQKKVVQLETHHCGKAFGENMRKTQPPEYAYGPMDKVPRFNGTHPAVMRDWIASMDWADELAEGRPAPPNIRHNWLKYRFRTWLEQTFLGGRQVFGSKNYVLVKDS